MQTLVVVLLGFFLGKYTAAATVLAYLAEGSLGLPIFASGGLGLAHLIGPTGGYLLAFVLAAYFSALFYFVFRCNIAFGSNTEKVKVSVKNSFTFLSVWLWYPKEKS